MVVLSGSSRPDRIAAIYPVMFAAGAVALEAWTAARRRALRYVSAALVAAGGAALAPLMLPLLQPKAVAAYAAAIGVLPQVEKGKTSPIPQWLADRTGWEEFVGDVERVVLSLAPEDRRQVVIYGSSYGPAGAVEHLGARRGLGPVISPHNSYFDFSRAEVQRAEVLVAAGASRRLLEEWFEEVHLAAVHRCEYCMSWRNEMPIYVARRPRVPLSEVWPAVRHYE
jgi:hypothetical protein